MVGGDETIELINNLCQVPVGTCLVNIFNLGFSATPHKCHPVPLHRGNCIIIPGGFFRPVDNEGLRIVI